MNKEMKKPTKKATKKHTDGWADQVIHHALVNSAGGLDLDLGTRVIGDALEVMAKQIAALKLAHYDPKKPEQVSRSFTYIAKALSEFFRLKEFAQGQPDSRPDAGKEWIQLLTDQELHELMRRAERSQAEEEEEKQ